MLDVIGLSAIVDLAYALGAVAGLFFGLRFLDRRVQASRWPLFNLIKENALAAAIYLGARWIGACLLVGLLLGR